MNPTLNLALPCAVFGHNYVFHGPYRKKSTKLVCKHCGSPLKIDESGDIVEDTFTNKAIQSTLRQLYHIKLKLSKSY